MLFRKIESFIREYLTSNSNKILVIDGARQIGKSYIIRKVGEDLFKENYIEINFVQDKEGNKLFENVNTVEDFYFTLSTVAGDKMKDKKNTLIFLDEIQEYPQFITLLKFLKQDDKGKWFFTSDYTDHYFTLTAPKLGYVIYENDEEVLACIDGIHGWIKK